MDFQVTNVLKTYELIFKNTTSTSQATRALCAAHVSNIKYSPQQSINFIVPT